MTKKAVRRDKKFLVKVWVPIQNKAIFRQHCMEYHLSMMFVGEVYLTTPLKEFNDERLSNIIENKLDVFNTMKSGEQGYEPLGIRITNDYWQKLAFFAVNYHTSVAKVASCLFDYAVGAYELQGTFEEFGLTFRQQKREKIERQIFNERLSGQV